MCDYGPAFYSTGPYHNPFRDTYTKPPRLDGPAGCRANGGRPHDLAWEKREQRGESSVNIWRCTRCGIGREETTTYEWVTRNG